MSPYPGYTVSGSSRIAGRNIRRIRQQLGLSLDALGKLAGLTPGAIGHAERGDRNITVATLEAVAPHLRTTVADLLTEPAVLPALEGADPRAAAGQYSRRYQDGGAGFRLGYAMARRDARLLFDEMWAAW